MFLSIPKDPTFIKWNEHAQLGKDLQIKNQKDANGLVKANLLVKPSAFKGVCNIKEMHDWTFTVEREEVKVDMKTATPTTSNTNTGTKSTEKPETDYEEQITTQETIREEVETNIEKRGSKDDYKKRNNSSVESHSVANFTLKRWREYSLRITAVNQLGIPTTKTFSHDTKEWACNDGKTRIPQRELCNNIKDCPGGEDEGEVCNPSPLPRNLSFLCYAGMSAIIIIYIAYKSILNCCQRPERNIPLEKKTDMITKDRRSFVSKYKDSHANMSEFPKFIRDVKYELHKTNNPKKKKEVCQWIRQVEQEVHLTPKERYSCILKNFTGEFIKT